MAKKKEPTVVDVLKRTRTILRKGWTQHVFARTATGRECDARSPRAVAFCIYGARARAIHELDGVGLAGRADQLLNLAAKTAVSLFNDTRGRKKSEVIEVVTRAIKKAEAAATL